VSGRASILVITRILKNFKNCYYYTLIRRLGGIPLIRQPCSDCSKTPRLKKKKKKKKKIASSLMSFDFSGWLTSIGLSQYAGTLSANGYDDYEVISALDETDRDVFPDIVPGHWKKLMIKVQQLKKDGGFQQPQAAWVAVLSPPPPPKKKKTYA
jgi:hypothetical protein